MLKSSTTQSRVTPRENVKKYIDKHIERDIRKCIHASIRDFIRQSSAMQLYNSFSTIVTNLNLLYTTLQWIAYKRNMYSRFSEAFIRNPRTKIIMIVDQINTNIHCI